jgi:hypothetical protein
MNGAMTFQRLFRVRLSGGWSVVIDWKGLILCSGDDTRAPERRAPAPLNSTLDERKVGTDE